MEIGHNIDMYKFEHGDTDRVNSGIYLAWYHSRCKCYTARFITFMIRAAQKTNKNNLNFNSDLIPFFFFFFLWF